LIIRGVAFEFRSKDDNPRWRQIWDWALFVGSLLPALLLGVAFANFVRGVPIDENMMYVGGFWNLLNPYALLGGVVSLLGLTLHGAIYLSLKVEGDLQKKAQETAWRLWIPSIVVIVLFTVATYFATDILGHLGVNPGVVPIAAVLTLLGAGYFIYVRRSGWAFFLTSLTILFSISTIFLVLFPRVMVSSINPLYSLTIYNTASGPNTLRVMTIVTLILVPIVLAYTAWMYWIFRKRITGKSELHY
jgi:cytochrome bd ubiquinol oxidase subunit II